MKRTATCGCKNVQVVVQGDPVRVFACHCDYCQRLTGSVASVSAIFKEENVLSVSGKTEIYEPPKWPGAKIHFCSVCFSRVHWVNPGAFPGMHLFPVGCFGDTNFPAPSVVTQTKYRPSWCPEFTGADHFDGYSGR